MALKSTEMAEVKIYALSMQITLVTSLDRGIVGAKDYRIRIVNLNGLKGIEIQCNQTVEVVKQSETKHWLVVR
jgi:hypothetical protein